MQPYRYWLLIILCAAVTAAKSQGAGCPDKTVPGKITVNQQYACTGATLTFNLVDYTHHSEFLYFLESAATREGTYNIIAAPASDPADLFTVASPGIGYYRIGVYCKVGQTYTYSDTIAISGFSGTPMKGKYTINPAQGLTATNFPSFGAAIAAMSCAGISDAVVFDVTTVNTTYNEQLLIPEIPGASAANSVTFNGNGNTIAFKVTNPQVPGIITLNGADYITIDSFRINAILGESGFGVHLTNDADNNTISRCTVNAGVGSASSMYAGMVISANEFAAFSGDSRCDNNLFVNNKIAGGYLGMGMAGNNNSIITGNKFIGNEITDFDVYGIYIDYADYSIVAANSISQPTRAIFSNRCYGISLQDYCKGSQIAGNSIFNMSGGDASNTGISHGIYLSACDAVETAPNIIYNNLIYNFKGAGSIYGLYSGSSDYGYFYHNTVSLDNSGIASAFTRGFYQEAPAAGVVFQNNIISITRTGGGDNHAMYIASVGNTYTSDHNNLYVADGAASYTGFSGSTNRAKLADWQTGTGKDAASLSVNPGFLSIRENNLRPNNPLLDNKGIPAGIASDYAGVLRNASTPDIGAYEFAQLACATPPNAGVVSASETPVCASGSTVLSLNGGDVGAGITYQWQSSPDSAAWVNIASATGTQATVTQTVATWYRVVSTCGAGNTPSAGVKVGIIPPVKGEFTINRNLATAGNNFQSFADAWNSIKCGINGPVVFNVTAGTGPYNEQLIVTPVNGASKENTITFNGNGNTITWAAVNNNERATIKLNGADHFIFNNLVVVAEGKGDAGMGYGIHLINSADSNIIKGCTIRVDAVNANSYSYAGIAVSGVGTHAAIGAAGCDNNVFEDNSVNGGYYGITLSSTNELPNKGNIIRRNQVINFNGYGLYITASNGSLIDSNVISRPTRNILSAFQGIYLTGAHSSDVITRNTITNPFGGSVGSSNWFYGINLSSATAAKGAETLISNNLIYNINGGGYAYALYNSGSGYALYQHNTVYMDGAVSDDSYITACFFQEGSATGIDVRNNQFSISRSGAGAKYALYFASAGSALTSDYNNFYNFSTDGDYYTGYWAYNRKTLVNWQAAGFDSHSLNSDPLYTNIAAGNFAPSSSAVDNLAQPLNGLVPGDITGTARSTAAPDMGAYEFTAQACTTPPVAGTVLATDTVVCANATVGFNLTGNGAGSAQTYQWLASDTEGGTYAPVSGVLTNPMFSLAVTNTRYYKMVTVCGAATSSTDAVKVTVNRALAAGTYTIDTNGTGHFLNFNQAKTAMACGITGPVVFEVLPTVKVYNEQLALDSITGSSAVNTVTFNGHGNTIHYGSQAEANSAVIRLNGTKYITFNELKITVDKDSAYGRGIFLTNNADNNTFNKCSVNIPLQLTTANYAGVVIGVSAANASAQGFSDCDNNQFVNDTITGGYYGVVLEGNNSRLVTGNRFTGNVVTDFHTIGFFLRAAANTVVEGNDISRPNRVMVSNIFWGIECTGEGSGLLITGNKIHNPGGGTALPFRANGIYLEGSGSSAGSPGVVANNLLYNFNNAGDVYGVYMSFFKNAHVYHNTLSLEDAANTGTNNVYGVYTSGGVAAGVELKNNLITIGRDASADNYGFYYMAGFGGVSDNNNVYIVNTGTRTGWGYSGARQATLAAWQTKTAADAHSLQLNPFYENAAAFNFTPTRGALDNKGVGAGIAADIAGAARSASTPDIGAYEFSTVVCTSPPTPGVAVVNPATGVCIGATVQLSLNGNSFGTNQKYVWQRAATQAGPWTAISDSIDISDYTYQLENAETWFRAVVVCGAGVDSATPAQVTLNAHLLGGDYTIDPFKPVGGSNFASFNHAVSAMACGIAGHVRFHVAAGTYTERVNIPHIPGTSANATVTFLSADNNAASVVLTSECTAEDENYVVRLDNSNYITFKAISVTATGTDYGRAVELAGSSSNDTVTACIITTPVAGGGDQDHHLSGVYGRDVTGVNNTVTKNTISNGHSGIYMFGVAHAAKRFMADDNKLSGAYMAEIVVKFVDSTSVSGNTITKTGMLNETSHGINVENCDSLYVINRNTITISNTASAVYGIQIGGCYGTADRHSSFSFNKIKATEGLTGWLYGMMESQCEYNNTSNNAIDVKVDNDNIAAVGLSATGNMKAVNIYHNSVRNASNSAGARAVMLHPLAVLSVQDNKLDIRNNIFANTGGGSALFVTGASSCYMDYNLYYSASNLLGQMEGTFATNLQQWQDAAMGDYHSLVYKPAFATSGILEPDVNSAEVWAMHGRGEQIAGDTIDINGNKRPVTLQEGVPDLGAYEFVPSSVPVSLTATPAAPVANSTQVFMLGTDTVTKITWGSVVPAAIEGKRYSGKAPENLAAGKAYMYFYTAFTTTGTAPKGHTAKQFYLDPWRGFIENEATIQMGKTNASDVWEVSALSRVNTETNVITDTGMQVLNKLTGLTEGRIATEPPPAVPNLTDSSNAGTQFWVGYGHHQQFAGSNAQNMVLYLSAGSNEAHVTVHVNGTGWTKNYTVPAHTVITSDLLPKFGPADARLLEEGLSDRGISISSDVPVNAWAHIYGASASGATMLMPVGTYGYEYYTLGNKQSFEKDTYAWFYVIAAYDSTLVEITPAQATSGGHVAGTPFRVLLRKGEVYQVMGAPKDNVEGYDLTGSKVRSVSNSNGKCYPVAVFSGSSKTSVLCTGNTNPILSTPGDNLIQQNFSYRTWGKKYLTVPTSTDGQPNKQNMNIFKVLVKDAATVVTRNGQQLTDLVNGRYYLVESSASDYIEADKPVMVAQFMPSGNAQVCNYSGFGDPEMIYLTPMDQGIKEATLYRTTQAAIVAQYVTVVIPDEGVKTLRIDGSGVVDYSYTHPNKPGYTVLVKRWNAANAQVTIKSDSAFTAIAYGIGVGETWGYNAGMRVTAQTAQGAISNVNNPAAGTYNAYTCVGTPVSLQLFTTLAPTRIEWKLGDVAGIQPQKDTTVDNPVAAATVTRNGVAYNQYALARSVVFDKPGTYTVPAYITHADIDACDGRMPVMITVVVAEAAVVDFTYTGTCTGTEIPFNGTVTTVNGAAVSSWAWKFADNGATATTQNTTHTYSSGGTYQVQLSVTDNNGCIADTVKQVEIKAQIAAPVVKVGVVTATTATFNWDVVTGATAYEVSFDNGVTWSTPSTGATGTSTQVTGLQVNQTVTIMVRALGGCVAAVSVAVSATTAVDEVFIPNTFSPDGNGPVENETFRVYGNAVKQVHMLIFNQWGEKIYETVNTYGGWDGTHKGKPQPSGVYIYVVDVTLVNNKHITKKGSVNLVR